MATLSAKQNALRRQPDKLHQAWIDRVMAFASSHFVTLATNWDGDGMPQTELSQIASFNRLFGVWRDAVDKRLLGIRFRKKIDERIMGWKFIEHPSTNIHAHLLINFHWDQDPAVVSALMAAKWNALCPSGSFDIRPIHDRVGIVDYCTKYFSNQTFRDLADWIS